MTDLLIRIRENNRRIVRGVSHDDRIGRFVCQIGEGETIKPQVDLTHWLGDASISSVTLSNDGGTVTQANADGVITLTVSGVDSMCDTDALITASDGRIRRERFRFIRPAEAGRDDYGMIVT